MNFFSKERNRDDWECDYGSKVLFIKFRGQNLKLTGHCFIDYGTAKYGDEYCTLYTDFKPDQKDPPIETMEDFKNHPVFLRNYNIDRSDGKSYDEIAQELNRAINDSNKE